ncbi:hypothetical protein [Mesorhizobium sp. SP-1A]|uniref:hypothetical protein n=1 Tax=Mesorhizobium sp. SP-1A TaxID=3077840 RepID=UPI0028F735EF|nr:hypothetical protein [Mesorhizobium sp. SP-1A]
MQASNHDLAARPLSTAPDVALAVAFRDAKRPEIAAEHRESALPGQPEKPPCDKSFDPMPIAGVWATKALEKRFEYYKAVSCGFLWNKLQPFVVAAPRDTLFALRRRS